MTSSAVVWRSLRLLAVLCSHAVCAQTQVVDYVIKPGDNPWDFARQHLKSGLVDALIDFNGIKDPHHLPPGMVLHIPDKWLFRGSRPVTVLDVTGAASRVVANGTAIPLKAGERIPARSHIVTADQESVVLQFSDGSRMLVREHSQVRLQSNKFVPLAEGRDIRLNIPKGKVENEISKLPAASGRFEIQTPSGIAAVRGTQFRVASFSDETRTEVLEGKVALAHKNGPHSALPAGYGMAMQKNCRVEAIPLLKAPQISEDSLLAERLPIDLQLAAVDDARRYRTLVSAKGLSSAVVSDQVTEIAVMRIRDIPDGDYVLRVRAIDAKGLEGEELVRPLTVNARPGPPFAISPGADARLAALRPEFSWARNSEASGYHFQLAANPEFKAPLIDEPSLAVSTFHSPKDLAEGKYYWRVATISASEGHGPFSSPDSFTRTPASPGKIGVEQQNLRWQKLDNARYRIQVGTEKDLEKPLIDRVVEQNSLTLDELDAGQYFVRIQTLGASGLSSQWTNVQSFTVESRFDWRYLLLTLPILLLL